MAPVPHVWEMADPGMRVCLHCPAIQRRQVYGWQPLVEATGGSMRFGPWEPVDQFCDLGAAARRLADEGKGMGRAEIMAGWFFGTRYRVYITPRGREPDGPWWVATFRHRILAERFCAAMGWEIVP